MALPFFVFGLIIFAVNSYLNQIHYDNSVTDTLRHTALDAVFM
jgi:hypothetical protein